MLTRDDANALIDYLELLEEHTNHQRNMVAMQELGYSEAELDRACRALGKIAHRDYSIL